MTMDESPLNGDQPTWPARDAAFLGLLEQAREGSDAALGELVESCQDYLLLIANQEVKSQIRGKFAASDAVQETLAVAHQRFDQFRGVSREELIGWLRAILCNQILTTNRQFTAAKRDVGRELHTTENHAPVRDNYPSPRAQAIEAEEAVLLRRALEKLNNDQRTVIVLRNWEQLPFGEVAQRMERSEDAAKKLWSRAMQNLKKELTHEANGGST